MCAWIQRACHKASCEPREPIVNILVTKPVTRLVAQAENLSNSGDEVVAVRQRSLAPKLRDGSMRHLVDDAFGQRVQSVFLFRCECSELAAHTRQLRCAQMFQLLLQADDGGN